MTKRFTGEFDKQYSGVYDEGEQLTNFEVVDLLNDLHEERNYFERKKCRYWNKFNLAHLDNINLRKENEQLKSKINKLDDKLYSKECDVFDLKKEKEQLKHRVAISEKANFVTTLEKENEHIKTTIKTMMENERTELGRSVLRQLWEAIQ